MSSTSIPYIIGNWKMNLDIESAIALAGACAEIANEARDYADLGVAVPFPWIPAIASEYYESNLLIGAQDVSPHPQGAFTGEVSAAMLAPWCAFSLVGHSERRQYHGETDETIRDKVDALLASSVSAVICVGETRAQRDAGETQQVISNQLLQAIGHLNDTDLGKLVVAYEPVWAIGTGQTASARDAQEVAAHLRGLLGTIGGGEATGVPILYGGSVNPVNAATFFAEDDIDGALIGGASLNADDMLEIVRAAMES